MVQPLTLWSAPGGPNPFKVAILLEELKVPYELKVIGYSKLKAQPYTDINPNGRAPAIEDPNTGITVWESGAIAQYLVETYDPSNTLHAASGAAKYHQLQWLAYQISGQGPYFGQAAWFNLYHAEKLPSAQARYMDEINRVVGVLDAHLGKSGGWLVGGELSFVDLFYIMWGQMVPLIFGEEFKDRFDVEKYPNYKKWLDGMKERESVKKVLADQQTVIADMMAGKYP